MTFVNDEESEQPDMVDVAKREFAQAVTSKLDLLIQRSRKDNQHSAGLALGFDKYTKLIEESAKRQAWEIAKDVIQTVINGEEKDENVRSD